MKKHIPNLITCMNVTSGTVAIYAAFHGHLYLAAWLVILAMVFLGVFYNPDVENKRAVLTLILVVSAISDLLDGKIARRFNMVSELGKILDPVADKITQGVLLICLLSKYDLLKWMFVFFLLKETYMAIAGIKVLERTNRNDGAMWYGKVNTTVFYIVMLLLIFLPDMPTAAANTLIIVCIGFMALSLVLYVRRYQSLIKKSKEEQEKSGS